MLLLHRMRSQLLATWTRCRVELINLSVCVCGPCKRECVGMQESPSQQSLQCLKERAVADVHCTLTLILGLIWKLS